MALGIGRPVSSSMTVPVSEPVSGLLDALAGLTGAAGSGVGSGAAAGSGATVFAVLESPRELSDAPLPDALAELPAFASGFGEAAAAPEESAVLDRDSLSCGAVCDVEPSETCAETAFAGGEFGGVVSGCFLSAGTVT